MKPAKSISTAASTGASRPLVLAAVFFILGGGLTGAWFHYHESSRNADELSEPVRNALEHLAGPVTIRFYSLLPAGSASVEEQAFSGRVEKLLAAVQAGSAGKIQVTRLDATAAMNVAAAEAEGIQAFNLDKGDACFLGLVIAGGKNRETFGRLQPEWESALPSDLARAILRVAAETPPPVAAKVVPLTPAITNEILKLIPDIKATSPEDANRIFRQDFLDQCAKAGVEMEAQINAAAQEVVKAQTSGSPADLEAARKKLSQVQFDQTEKLKEVAAHLQLQLDAFQQMKAATTNSVK